MSGSLLGNFLHCALIIHSLFSRSCYSQTRKLKSRNIDLLRSQGGLATETRLDSGVQGYKGCFLLKKGWRELSSFLRAAPGNLPDKSEEKSGPAAWPGPEHSRKEEIRKVQK